MKTAVVAIATLALALAGCASVNGIPSTALTPVAEADLEAALASYCPVLVTVETTVAAAPSLATTDVKAALSVLAEACPPNPSPTNGVVVAVDVINAYVTLERLMPKSLEASEARKAAHYKAIGVPSKP